MEERSRGSDVIVLEDNVGERSVRILCFKLTYELVNYDNWQEFLHLNTKKIYYKSNKIFFIWEKINNFI